MRRFAAGVCLLAGSLGAQAPFTIRQAMSAPYATSLTAAPVGARFAWVESVEGVHNLWVGGPKEAARQLTHYTQDDGQDISQLAWSPDGETIAYVYGAETGAAGKPADPTHTGSTPNTILLQPVKADAKPIAIGEGRSPMFFHHGCGVLFLKGGKVWVHGLKDEPKPNSLASLRKDPNFGRTNGADDPPECDRGNGSEQLIFDRGTASQLTLSPNGYLLAFISRRSEANEPAHSYLAVFDLMALALTFPSPSTGNDSAPAFSPDGGQIAWIRTPFTPAPEFALDRTSPNFWSIQLLTLVPCFAKTACSFLPDTLTAPVLNGTALRAGSRTIFAPEARKPGSVLPHLATGSPKVFWTADGRVVFYSEADGWVHLYALDLKRPGLPMLLTPGKYEVEDATVSGDGRAMVYAANDTMADPLHPEPLDADRRHLWGLDLTQAQPVPVFLTRGAGNEVHPALSASGAVLAALVADARTAMMPALIDAEGKIAPMHAVTANAAMVVPQQVLMTAKDGVKVHGQMFVAQAMSAGVQASNAGSSASLRNGNKTGNGNRKPALIFVHGGPRREMLLGYPAMEYYSNAYAINQYLASSGFVVLSVNYRCGIGYGMNFRQCEHGGADGAAEYADVLAAVAYLRGRADVDPKRIGIWGGSYGGYLTAMALARNSELFAAGVDFHGVHEWALEDNAATDWLRGPGWNPTIPAALAAKAHASSPMGDLSRWKSPVLLIHGDDDANVSYAQTPLLADALRARNVHVEELIFPDEIHEFLLHKDWVEAYESEAAFFVRVLRP